MTITVPVAIADPALPLADPADRATFTARKLEHLRWEKEVLSPGALALGTASYNNALDAQARAGEAAASATDAAAQKVLATAQANAAAASAASALTAPGTNATSTTSMTVGTGSQAFTLAQTGKSFVVGQWVSISDSAAPTTNWMLGAITAFNAGTGAITVSVSAAQGTLTGTSWVIAASAPTKQDMTIVPVSGTTQTAVVGNHYVLNNVAATAVTMPTAFSASDRITISQNNGLFTNTVDFGAKTVRGPAGAATGVVTMNGGFPMELVAIDSNTWMML